MALRPNETGTGWTTLCSCQQQHVSSVSEGSIHYRSRENEVIHLRVSASTIYVRVADLLELVGLPN